MKFKVMTFNIQHGRNHNLTGDIIDLKLIADTAKKEAAQIIGFNEVRKGISEAITPKYANQPQILAEKLNGYCEFAKAIEPKENHCYGNAVFSETPFEVFEVIPIPDPEEKIEGYYYESRNITKSIIRIDGIPVTVLTSHFGLAPNEQENAVETVIRVAYEIETPLIFMGDLNMTPENSLIKRLSDYFTDALESIGKDEPTFPSDSPKIRIDYIFYKGLKLTDGKTVHVVSSDHFPVVAEFAFI